MRWCVLHYDALHVVHAVQWDDALKSIIKIYISLPLSLYFTLYFGLSIRLSVLLYIYVPLIISICIYLIRHIQVCTSIWYTVLIFTF